MSSRKLYVMKPEEDLDDVLDREFGKNAFTQAVALHKEASTARIIGLLKHSETSPPVFVCEVPHAK